MGTAARAAVLDPAQPFVVMDRTIPRAGLVTDRYFRRARTPDGSTVLWLARRSGPGTGQGWSGLRFDSVGDMAPAPEPRPSRVGQLRRDGALVRRRCLGDGELHDLAVVGHHTVRLALDVR